MRVFTRVITAFLMIPGIASSALGLPECKLDSPVGTFCKSKLSELRPTQLSVGYRSVQDKARDLKEMGGDEYDRYLDKNPIPVVIGPQGFLYLLDHHHLARAIYEVGHHKVIARVMGNWHGATPVDFWSRMKANQLAYLFDANGAPLQPSELPTYVWLMRDDPYRSLSGEVQDHGGFRKGPADYFIEFKWALFFRRQLGPVDLKSDSGFKKAVKQALKLAHSSLASGMPGYVPEAR
jgi:hypothetical protein